MGTRQNDDEGPLVRPPSRYADSEFVPDFSSGVVRFPYRREPYARVQLRRAGGGTETRDAKVLSRTGDSAYLNISFPDEEGRPVSLWVPSGDATRIPAGESSWRDPYDVDWA